MEWMQELATALIPLLAAFCGWAAARLRAGTKKDKTMEYGMKMLLRERIIDRGMHYLCLLYTSVLYRAMAKIEANRGVKIGGAFADAY